ncbi:MAG: DNA mismatch repair protein MutS, partial [Proteobacteria bacterium]|nr:DNA mismatch repair protein MutS [Pseudomonadota bacterium]
MNLPMKTQASLALPLDLPTALTPVMAQYQRLKDAHPGCLLFFRLGDFYELFHDDALSAAPVLDVALTKREDVPMCGVPVHAYEAYLPKLIRAGFRVAIAEQMEDPDAAKKRGTRVLVDRQVVRIITPGTVTEDSFLEARANNYLAVMALAGGEFGLAWCDLCEGTPYVASASREGLNALLARVNPGELVVPETLREKEDWHEFLRERRDALTLLPQSRFDSANAEARALSQYGVKSLEAFGNFSRAGTAALGVLIDYIALTQKQKVNLNPPQAAAEKSAMAIDAATRRNLELTQTLSGSRKGSLLEAIDITCTSGGARLLADQLCAPLCEVAGIERRLQRVDFFAGQADLRGKIRALLKTCPDLSRALARLALSRGGPRDLAALRAALEVGAQLGTLLDTWAKAKPNADLQALRRELGDYAALAEKLGRALKPDLPILTRDGGFIAAGFSPALDEFITLRDDSKKLIAGLQAKYVAATKIANLRIRHNQVIGYHVEVTPTQADRLLSQPKIFIHRQTLQSGVRFTTTELAGLERKVSEAGDKALALEMEIFAQLCEDVLARNDNLRATCAALASFDVATSLAELAVTRRWCRPRVDDSHAFHIEKGRHPVVEAALALAAAGEAFTANDCNLGAESRLWLVTGPNMAGKSTFLRQNALIAALAQMGSYVPAQAAHLGVVDRLFSRVGAADDLARGRSTFMVEMVETAAILNQASEKSLVILDEIGRGTATFDGLSIAWAAVEYLYHHNRCRALFAAHYHELTALKEQLPALYCATALVREWEGNIIFLHEVKGGVADRSYGIHVAQLAGLPGPVITRATGILQALEKKEGGGKITLSAVQPRDFEKPLR